MHVNKVHHVTTIIASPGISEKAKPGSSYVANEMDVEDGVIWVVMGMPTTA